MPCACRKYKIYLKDCGCYRSDPDRPSRSCGQTKSSGGKSTFCRGVAPDIRQVDGCCGKHYFQAEAQGIRDWVCCKCWKGDQEDVICSGLRCHHVVCNECHTARQDLGGTEAETVPPLPTSGTVGPNENAQDLSLMRESQRSRAGSGRIIERRQDILAASAFAIAESKKLQMQMDTHQSLKVTLRVPTPSESSGRPAIVPGTESLQRAKSNHSVGSSLPRPIARRVAASARPEGSFQGIPPKGPNLLSPTTNLVRIQAPEMSVGISPALSLQLEASDLSYDSIQPNRLTGSKRTRYAAPNTQRSRGNLEPIPATSILSHKTSSDATREQSVSRVGQEQEQGQQLEPKLKWGKTKRRVAEPKYESHN